MVTIGMNYQVLPGKEEVFERAFARVLEELRKSPGHVASQLYKEVENPRSYLITSEWSEKTAFETFIRSEGFRKVTDWGKEQILAGRPKHTIYTHDSH